MYAYLSYFSPIACFDSSLTSTLIDRRGNKQLVAICVANIVIYALAKLYYIWRNKQRDRDWNAMTKEVRLELHVLENAKANTP